MIIMYVFFTLVDFEFESPSVHIAPQKEQPSPLTFVECSSYCVIYISGFRKLNMGNEMGNNNTSGLRGTARNLLQLFTW
jgi:hypothetical protein